MATPEIARGKIPTSLIPQADRPELVIGVLSFINEQGRRPHEGEGSFTNRKRQLDYACHAATLLGFLDHDDRVTDTGRMLLTLNGNLRLLRLIFAFEASDVGQAWVLWAGVKELAEIEPKTAADFLGMRAENADASTTKRRADTLRSWAEKFRELRGREAGPNLTFGDWVPHAPLAPSENLEFNVFVEDG